MDIFKLFFDHDLRLDKPAKRNANKSPEEIEATLADFMKPTPTYSKFYITGTRLDKEQFGLNALEKATRTVEQLGKTFEHRHIHVPGTSFRSLAEALASSGIGEPMVIADEKPGVMLDNLNIDNESNIVHRKQELREILTAGGYVLYKEQAHHGFDLHLLTMENIYPALFRAFQPLVSNDFRFFSINSKRMRSERHFYFETWTLDRPPHGAEEVSANTVL
ncbi:hypothetical protein [Fodinibius sediminis]|uniref:Uncharacterized protein n=1 Tax=Fodinibius sediminis TaxID=1214077 RepID=A0A521D3Z6_9BACT|nr:hypothetical protein [Fodinibius sediminis]SMO66379.1 hypothetical protein SAMN06265218_108108 [Fodinibius sediminis]